MSDTSAIELKMDVLNEKGNEFVSVTDLYDISIFTDENMLEFQNRETQENTYYADVGTKVFLDNREQTENAFLSGLFLEEVAVSKKEEFASESQTMNTGIFLIGVFVFIIFVLAMLRYNIYRRVRRRKDADNGNLYR